MVSKLCLLAESPIKSQLPVIKMVNILRTRVMSVAFIIPRESGSPEHIDIVAVGNSFTLGYCVPSDKNFVALIRRRYPGTLNLGMPGKGPLQVLATLKEYGVLLKPKLVLWFYSEANSLPELQYEKQSRILMRYLSGDFTQGLLARQSI